jgi:hypothetical protein
MWYNDYRKKEREMKNLELFKKLVEGYMELAYTGEYLFGFEERGNIYLVKANDNVLAYVCKLEKASRGQGYSLRFKPNKAQRELLKQNGYTILCSARFFEELVKTTKYNKGEVFEKLVTEYFGQEWEKDNVPFTEDGDITVDGIAYQIKYTAATFTNEKTLMRMMKRD